MTIPGLLGILSLALLPGERHEDTPWPWASGPCEEASAQGRAALEADQPTQAVRLLSEAVAQNPTCTVREGGLAGEWLGRAWVARGDTATALSVWAQTLRALDEATWATGGDRLVGVYLDLILRARGRPGPSALDAFSLLMRPTTDRVLGPEYRQLLAQLASVVPDSVRQVAFREGDWRQGIGDASGALAAWWLGEDPYPATAPNERVEEHLDRVAYALRAYPHPRTATGYDDRGTHYVRFGAPTVARRLAFNDSQFLTSLSETSAGITRQSFPNNEVWTYESIDETMVYVFVQSGETFRLGQSEDLLPAQLRNVVATTPRQQEQATAALIAMRYIYGQLATTSMEYGSAWGEVEALLSGTASPVRTGLSSVSRDVLRSTSLLERERGRVRADREPPSRSRIYEDAPALPFSAQSARFLMDDGQTRLELWWQADLQDEAVREALPGDAAVVGSVVNRPTTFDRETVVLNVQDVEREAIRGRDRLPVQVASAPCDDDGCLAALQIDVYDQSRTLVGFGPRVRTAVWRPERVDPLRASGLELSDLKPLDATLDEPIPQAEIVPGTQLSIYFEAYGLRQAPGPARFTVEYEVVLRQRGSILRRTAEDARAGQLRSVERGSRTEQYLLLSTADWAASDEVDVTVRVRDDRTAESVERTLRLAVQKR